MYLAHIFSYHTDFLFFLCPMDSNLIFPVHHELYSRIVTTSAIYQYFFRILFTFNNFTFHLNFMNLCNYLHHLTRLQKYYFHLNWSFKCPKYLFYQHFNLYHQCFPCLYHLIIIVYLVFIYIHLLFHIRDLSFFKKLIG